MPSRATDSDEGTLQARVTRHLEILDLPALAHALPEILAWARKERPSDIALLDRALTLDAERTHGRRLESRLKASGLPDRPTLETFDFPFQPGLDKSLVLQFAELDFVRQHEDLVLVGNSGTGKSHIVKSIAVRAAVAGISVVYRRFHTLMDARPAPRRPWSHPQPPIAGSPQSADLVSPPAGVEVRYRAVGEHEAVEWREIRGV